jgi:hypothetical protein
MYPRPTRLFFAVSLLLLTAAPGLARERPPEMAERAPLRTAIAPMDTSLLAAYDFEGPGGQADPQGWTTRDRTVYPAFFHVDDFAGMPAPYAPLRGAKSLWCGVRNDAVYCTYNAAPGYGNSWMQFFESVDFPASGEVHVDYLARWDVEPGYDFVWVEYLSKTGTWQDGGYGSALNGMGAGLQSTVVPGDSLAGTTRIRFVMYSDGAFSDEEGLFPTDGAIEIDSLTVWDGTGVVDFQDFETEAVGATTTADGDWTAHALPPFGDYAALFDGDTVLQEDTLTFNHSNVWGFFNNSPLDMACLGHAEQLVPPNPPPIGPGFRAQFGVLWNEVVSPPIDLRTDINGAPVPWAAKRLVIDFDLYGDIQVMPSHVQYSAAAEYLVDGCWNRGQGTSTVQEDDGRLTVPVKAWVRRRGTATIPTGATHVRAILRAVEFNQQSNADPHCHNQSPLYDNVEVRVVTEYTTGATNTPAATHLEQNVPNPFNPVTTIGYTLAASGHVRLRIYDVTGALVRTLVDGVQSAGEGPFRVEWDGRANDGAPVASGVYFYRLETAGNTETRRMVMLK